MTKIKTKGTVVIWIAGILSTIVLSYGGITTTTLLKHSETNATQDTNIALNKNNIENIEDLMEDIKTSQNLLLDYFKVPRN